MVTPEPPVRSLIKDLGNVGPYPQLGDGDGAGVAEISAGPPFGTNRPTIDGKALCFIICCPLKLSSAWTSNCVLDGTPAWI